MTDKLRVRIIVAIIISLGVIIAAIISGLFLLKSKTVEITLINTETTKEIPGMVYIDASKDGVVSVPGKPAVIELKRKNRSIRVESEGYKEETIPTENIASPRIIALKPIAAVSTPLTSLPMIGFNTWANGNGRIAITPGAAVNECIINSNGRLPLAAGFTFTGLDILAGKTVVLQFANTAESDFIKGRMFKLGKSDETAFEPANSTLIENEYIPQADTPSDGGIEYPIPENFDGSLSFVFYQGDIRNLRIKAFYK